MQNAKKYEVWINEDNKILTVETHDEDYANYLISTIMSNLEYDMGDLDIEQLHLVEVKE